MTFGQAGTDSPCDAGKDLARSVGRYNDKAVHDRYVSDPERS